MKKVITIIILTFAALAFFTACFDIGEFNSERYINVVSREAGSGTRGAFIELVGMVVDGDDMTFRRATIAPGTNQVITSVANNRYAIGYITMGSLSERVRALPIDGIYPNPANVLNGSYPIYRPFYIAARRGESPLRDDFIDFILSYEGQAIVSEDYVAAITNPTPFTGGGLNGTIVIVGSTAVAPVLTLLGEAFEARNPGVVVEVHPQGTTAGINQAIDRQIDIGMSSRPLTPAELAEIEAIAIAYDGLAVIVNNENPVMGLTLEDVRRIFTAEIMHWNLIAD
ncbi:MAG: substrate-binding domain-containing protein [Clostridiales bacterium]|jgi:phosphate transport system substrate-binding protein|nr:substrate-binding domain-containing protein [Clostridiales bacterium]